MPELPEVETIRRDLEKELKGKTVLDVVADVPKVLQPSLKEVANTIKGRRIEGFERKGKLLLIKLSGGQPKADRPRDEKTLGVHLRLTGRLLVRKEGDPPDEWQRAVIKLSGGKELRFADLRLFAYIKLFKDQKELGDTLSKIGPEPLSGELDGEKFYEIIKRTSRPIKVVLLDQTLISGVGNIYANEALFEAGIHPQTKTNALTRNQAIELYRAIEQVLKDGLALRGATIGDEMYRDAYGKRGSYEKKVRVYQRAGKSCPKCGTEIKRSTVGGRGTFFCPNCQKEDADQKSFLD
ncbi:DNA-formamidopyrimidine glycosylase [candidate division WWE3 bacterium CG_4_9_14_0_2_um_filter_48_10]|uniref:Formamidopyrimidine-DNA glycosylase n=1 Tax=candidate division WWE3 bacterium CG_4_9_14_0_2_um_filter_48_10 TaxID=1975078 RepID=A0A2M8EJK7_UNCKA|nr:MAG: DNA-formamidopyrimidine glycosylase [candidate division WWE3 bacterium CG_4_9_14_0_2_um_filter_48_10]